MAGSAPAARRQAQGAGLLLGLALAACANVEAPPGGPPDTNPPAVVRVRPESGTVAPNLKGAVVIQFDEVIDEMAGAGAGGAQPGGGLAGLARQVVLSPVAGAVAVSWKRSAIHVKPEEGWQPGRVYRLELLPGIADLRRNRMTEGRTVVFSTGPEPPPPGTGLSGTALQWVEQRALMQGLIQAVPQPDTVAYVTFTDSAGEFRLGGIPPGRYVVYAVHDQNHNRVRDRREAYDSITVTLDSTASALLWTFVHDSLGPRLRAADPLDSLTFRLQFSQPLDPAAPLDSARVRVFALPDSTPVPVRAVLAPRQYDSLVARERAVADSLRRAAQPDTAPPPARGAPAPAARRAPAVAGAPTADTSQVRRLLAQRPAPSDRLAVRVARPLAAGGKYLIRVSGATNLSGAAADGQAVLTIPATPARAPRDTTRSP